VRIIGLSPGAQIIILQAVATYLALLSAYFFARPVLREQTLRSHRELLSELASDDQAIQEIINSASAKLTTSAQTVYQRKGRRDNFRGIALLVLSGLLFTGAVVLQLSTDPSF
jgi:hypothetical protein